jgi:hypothetical protein
MIRANELRCNNYVKCSISNDHAFYRICQVDSHNQLVRFDSTIRCELISLKDLKPIPLTEELLLKCGFPLENGYGHRTQYGWIHKVNGEYYWKYYQIEVNINSVHLLQNTYERFHQKELPINL